MPSTYTYSLSSDFGGNIDEYQLGVEIQANGSITSNFSHINTNDDDVDIVFDTALTSGEQTVLLSIISEHVPDLEVVKALESTLITYNDSPYKVTKKSVQCDTSGGNITVSLGKASRNNGKYIYIKKTHSANIVTIDGFDSEMINGSLTYTLTDLNEIVVIKSNGTGWDIVSGEEEVDVAENLSKYPITNNKGDITVDTGNEQRALAAGSNGHVLMADSTIDIGLKYSVHDDITGSGAYSHTQIDSHIDDSTLHFTKAQINHTQISNHDAIDDHGQYLRKDGRANETDNTFVGSTSSGGNAIIKSNSTVAPGKIKLVDSTQVDEIDSYTNNSTFKIAPSRASKVEISKAGVDTEVKGNLNVAQGVDVTGNITLTGNIDGRDVASDGATLDNLNTTLGLGSLTAHEVSQVANIGTYEISASNWNIVANTNQGVSSTDDVTFNSIAVTTTVDGRDVSADGTKLDNLYDTIGLKDLTTAEVNQLENIGTTSISSGNWIILGNTDQGVATTDDVTFNSIGVTTTVDGRDVSADGTILDALQSKLGDITAAEADQIEKIGSTTISATNWGRVGAMNQGVATTDNVTFNQITGTLQTANQPNITNVGTLDSATIDNIYLNNNEITTNSGSLTLNSATGKVFVTGNPTDPMQIATKEFVELMANGIKDYKDSARLKTAGTLGNCTHNDTIGVGSALTADANGALSVDGVSVSLNDRILVTTEGTVDVTTNQGDVRAHNGIYSVTQVGDAGTPWILTRSTDADEDSNVTAGMMIYVTEGNKYAQTGWVLSNQDTITVDTTVLIFNQYSGSGSTTGSNVGTAGVGVYDILNGNVMQFRNINNTTGELAVSLDAATKEIRLALIQSAIDHGSISGKDDDDHTQYSHLSGRSGGQHQYGGTQDNDDLVLESTSASTKGTIIAKDQLVAQSGMAVTGNVTVSGNVDGRDISADGSILDLIDATGIRGVTAAEINQLKTIDSVTINNQQWGRLGSLDQGVATTDDVTFNSIAVTSTVDGRDVSADGTKLDNLYDTIGLKDLTTAEVNQLENIGTTAISATNWGRLGAMNQGVATTDSVTFASAHITNNVTLGGTVDGRDIASDGILLDAIDATGVSSLTSAEVDQLENINDNTISYAQWGYLSNADQGISSSDDVTFNAVTAGSVSINGKTAMHGTEFQDSESAAQSTTTSSSFVQKLRMTTGNLPSGKYRVSWSFEIKSSHVSGMDVRIQEDDTTSIGQTFTNKNISGYQLISGFKYLSGISGIKNFDIDFKALDGIAYIRNARLEIWRMS